MAHFLELYLKIPSEQKKPTKYGNTIFYINISRVLIPLILALIVEKCKFFARYLTTGIAQTFQSPMRSCITPDIA